MKTVTKIFLSSLKKSTANTAVERLSDNKVYFNSIFTGILPIQIQSNNLNSSENSQQNFITSNEKVIPFHIENDPYCFKLFSANYILINSKQKEKDKIEFLEELEINLFQMIEEGTIVTNFIAWLDKNGSMYCTPETFSSTKKSNGFLFNNIWLKKFLDEKLNLL